MKMTSQFQLVPRSRIHEAIPLLPTVQLHEVVLNYAQG